MPFIALQNVLAHKRRLAGGLVAVCLGVAFLSGTLLLSDTLRTNFANLFAQANGRTDVIVRGAVKYGSDTRANTRVGLPAELVPRLRAQPGVADAQPFLQGFGRLLGANGKSFVRPGPPTFAANWVADPDLNPYRIVAGRPPAAPGEVVINRGAAKLGHLRLGSTTTVLVPQPIPVRVVGIATFGTTDGFGPSTFTAFTLADAERYLTTSPGQITEVLIKARSGAEPALAASLADTLPPGVQTITGAQQGQENYRQVNKQFLRFLRGALLAFAAIALVVGAFSIHNTFAVLAAQRGRESALLRALGASRRQVLAAATTEGAAVGATGSAVGLAAGVGIAGLLKGVFDSFGFALPAGGLAVRPWSLVIAFVTGLGVTVVAGASPAVAASRTAPLAAVRDIDTGSRAPSRRRSLAGSVLGAVGVALAFGTATVGHRSGATGAAAASAILTVAAAVLLSPAVAAPAARLIGRPIAKLRGVTGTLARDNAARQPRRTAGSAQALVIGVTVVALFTVVAASLKASFNRAVDQTVAGDLIIRDAGLGAGAGTLSPQLATDVRRLPQVQGVAGIGAGAALVDGASRNLTVADPAQLAGLVNLRIVAGTAAGLDGSSLAVSTTFAGHRHWRPGTAVKVTWPDGATGQVTVVALYTAARTDVVGDLLVAPAAWGAHDAQAVDTQVLVKLRPGIRLAAGQAAVAQAAAAYGHPSVRTRSQYKAAAAAGVNTVLGLVYAMLALSILIALLGIANTLSLSIHERTREIGLLRALGQTRAQARSMVRWEGVIVALFGTVGGLACGLLLGWALVRSAAGSALSVFAAPTAQVVAIMIAGALAGVLAAARPARRAARVGLLQALAIT
jgi:putative ABC transport system permease protein